MRVAMILSSLLALSAAQMPSQQCINLLSTDGLLHDNKVGEGCMITLAGIGYGSFDITSLCSGQMKTCMDKVVKVVPDLFSDSCFGQLPADVPQDLIKQVPIIYQDILDQGICVKSPNGNYCGGHLSIDPQDPNPDPEDALRQMCGFWKTDPCCFTQIQAVEQGLFSSFKDLLNISGNVPNLPDVGNATATEACKAVDIPVPVADVCQPVHIKGPGGSGTPVWVYAAAGGGALVVLVVAIISVRACTSSSRKKGYSIQADLA